MARADVFAARMKKRAEEIEKRLYKRANAIALAVQKYLVMETPVDTGAAISNWTLTLGAPNTNSFSPYAPGHLGSTRQMNIGAAYNQAVYSISDRRPGQEIWISNSLPYIVELNRGSSTQAPAGYVQAAVMRAVRETRGIKVIV